MRILRLALLRYGHFSDTVLDFDRACGLHVVLGANEAGKTTALAAIHDALFGVPHRTDYDFMHPGLRLGLSLCTSGGRTIEVVRRKGRRNTLRDAVGRVLAEDALAPFLGGIERERFSREFGLDAERLREGARSLGSAGAGVGEAVLAGLGLPRLRDALDRLDDEAKKLVGDGRGERRLTVAADRWKEACRRIDATTVRPQAWEDARAARDAAADEIEKTKAKLQDLRRDQARLERIRRVRPILAELDALRQRLDALSDIPDLPADAAARFHGASAKVREETLAADEAAVRKARHEAGRKAIATDPAVLAEADAIEALGGLIVHVGKAEQDLRAVRDAVAAARTRLGEAAAELDPNLEPERLRRTLPPMRLRERMQALLTRRSGLLAQRAVHERALRAATGRLAGIARELAALPPAAPIEPLRQAVQRARARAELEAQRAAAEAEWRSAKADLDRELAALPLFQGDAVQLAALALPLPAEIEAAGAALTDAARAEAEEAARLRDIETAIAGAETERAAIVEAGALPTREAIAAARTARDAAWALVRRQVATGEPPSRDDLDGLPRPDLADAFELLRDEADRLADARADEADRLARHAAVQERLERLSGERAVAETRHRAAAEALARTAAAWAALWHPAGIEPRDPAAMRDWMRSRERVLEHAKAATTAGQQLQDRATQLAAARDDLLAVLGDDADAAAQAHLAALLARAEAELEQRERAAKYRQQLADRADQQREELSKAETGRAEADSALATLADEWRSGLGGVGLPADATIETVEATLAAWRRLAEAAAALDTDEPRVADMQATIARFDAQARRIATTLGMAGDDLPGRQIAADLAPRLRAARDADSRAQDLDRLIGEESDRLDAARRAAQAAQADLDALRTAAGCTDDAALEQAIARAEERQALRARLAGREAALLQQGDGKTEPELRAEADGVDPDEAAGLLDGTGREIEALGARLPELGSKRQAAEATLAAMRQGDDAARAAQDAADALADATDAAERYVRLHMARTLLRRAVAHFREREWSRLLEAAGGYLATLTDGRWRRLVVDQDDSGQAVLLAVRADDERLQLSQLSEGTRDALALALRLAAIALHAESPEPLPFIADDILVAFDDARAARAMALLAELGQTTQVILFTHHGAIAAHAEGLPGAQLLRLPDAPPAQKKGPVPQGPTPIAAEAQAEVSSG